MPRDAIVGAVVLACAGIYWWAAGTIRHSSLDDPIGAAGVPNTLAVVLAGLAILLILRSLVFPSRTTEGERPASSDAAPRAHLRALGMLAIGIVYLMIISTLGYVLSVALLMGAVAFYNHQPTKPGLFLFALLGAGAFYVLFVMILDIPLPPGLWPRLLPI